MKRKRFLVIAREKLHDSKERCARRDFRARGSKGGFLDPDRALSQLRRRAIEKPLAPTRLEDQVKRAPRFGGLGTEVALDVGKQGARFPFRLGELGGRGHARPDRIAPRLECGGRRPLGDGCDTAAGNGLLRGVGGTDECAERHREHGECQEEGVEQSEPARAAAGSDENTAS